jgi:adenine/guanine phosphoribosyltransferase-like PRPP-binding protein
MGINKKLVIEAFNQRPLVHVENFKFLINPLTEQIPATSSELLRETSKWLIAEGNFQNAAKIVGEEDKGAILIASTSLMTGLPFGMARWYPSGLEGQVAVEFKMEYTSGRLFLNGVNDGDRVIIVDDMISTGGTMLALIKAIHQANAAIADIICVAEKVDYGGVSRVNKETGLQVKTLVKVSVSGDLSKVIEWANTK